MPARLSARGRGGQDSTGPWGDVRVSWTSCIIRENIVAGRRVVVEERRKWDDEEESPKEVVTSVASSPSRRSRC